MSIMELDKDSEETTEHVRYQKPRRYVKSPDFKARDAKVGEIRSSIKEIDEQISKISKDIEVTVTPKPIQEQRKGLTIELSSVIKTQGELKRKRLQINDQVKAIDLSLKQKINSIQNKTSKHSFKTAGEIDKRVKSLEDLIDTGSLKIVDERRYIKEISSLRRLRKDYASIEEEQKLIDSDKEKIKELKKSIGEASNKEAQAAFEKVTKQLDELSLQTKDIQKKRDDLFSLRRELYKNKDTLYDEMRAIRQDYDNQFQKFKQDLENEKKKREEEEKAYRLGVKKEELEAQIAKIQDESKKPANSNDIEIVENLLIHFDPSHVKTVSSTAIDGDSNKLNTHHRQEVKVEMPTNAVLIKKEPENFFSGSGKSRKSKKHGNKKRAVKFILEPVIISQLSSLGIPLPTSEEDSRKTIDLLKTKLAGFKDTQDEKTKANITAGEAKVSGLQKQIDAIEEDIEKETVKMEEAHKSKAKAKAEKDNEVDAEVEVEVEVEAEVEAEAEPARATSAEN
ncbi:hypothetical protein FOA43_004588 [Brettanomyces nanus]|uniref:Nuclear segregation protein BFR1 n=1 Tax=Eeniella nana TaxID=13502 RepID=A0A875SBU7_EENNA|nr:uncharacterized protein FOA43_004588 [Brettanomyces nanus]QPG77182.1 hypothetical protein FOA43_004588 [Brettanomyces nanus]